MIVTAKKFMLRFFSIIFFVFVVTFSWSQERCGTMDYNRFLKKSYPQIKEIANRYARTSKKEKETELPEIINIPIVFHIIYNENDSEIGSGTNLSVERIKSQLQVMNEDFRKMIGTRGYNTDPVGADTKIQFCLAGTDPNCMPTDGITRHKVKKGVFQAFDDDKVIKSYGYWPNTDYLNIWVCSLASGFIGYTQFPNFTKLPGLDSLNGDSTTDGIVIATKTIGIRPAKTDKDVYVFGRTVTHETGHWLGLLHTWGDQDCGTDYVDDTPICKDANLVYNCNPVYSNCSGIRTRQMIENYMDYSPDICMNIFTNGQTQRMYATLQVAPDRKKLLNSKGCTQQQNIIISPAEIKLVSPLENGWEVTTSGKLNWTFGDNNSKSYALFNSEKLPSNYAELWTPFIDFGNNNSNILSFDIAYPNVSETDSLVIYLYTGCNTEKAFIKSLSGKELITTSKSSFITVPSENEWNRIDAAIDNSDNKYGRIVFRIYSNSTANTYIKSISLTNSSAQFESLPTINGNGRQSIFNLKSEANFTPETYSIQMQVSFPPPSNVNFEIYNLDGKLVGTYDFINSYPKIFYLPVTQLSPGMYFVKTTVNGEQSVAKVIIYYR
ncbi:MAG: M43 family zinc metalloprotease [Bacteroidota bacterium]|nr:M43 family zinc metalloprotease [Bacteroidota bacterium]